MSSPAGPPYVTQVHLFLRKNITSAILSLAMFSDNYFYLAITLTQEPRLLDNHFDSTITSTRRSLLLDIFSFDILVHFNNRYLPAVRIRLLPSQCFAYLPLRSEREIKSLTPVFFTSNHSIHNLTSLLQPYNHSLFDNIFSTRTSRSF